MQWTVICFSTVDWDSYHQRPQLMAKALAEGGHRVVFVDNLGMRFPRPRDLGRVLPRLRRAFSRSAPERPLSLPKNLVVESPVVPPLSQFRLVRNVAARRLVRRLSRPVRPGPLLLLTYLPSPIVPEVARLMNADALVYDWCDDISERLLFTSSRHRARVRGWEEALGATADLVLFANEDFAARRGNATRNMKVVPHGVESGRSATSSRSPELESLPRPRVGYLGAITDWIDLDLIASLARARPQWSFPVVGPVQTDASRLAELPNVLLLGERPYEEVPALLRSFDVGLIPYRVTEATRSASPLKLREYLAAGIPVVSVDIPDTRSYAPPVRLADGREGFLEQIEQAVTAGPLEPVSSQRSWRAIAAEVIGEVEALERIAARSDVVATPGSRESLGT